MLAAAATLVGATVGAQELAPLGSLRGVSEVLIRSGHSDLSEGSLGRHVAAHLRENGLLVEAGGEPTGHLYLEVAPLFPLTSDLEGTAYEVRISLREPVRLSRAPGEDAHAITWQSLVRIGDYRTKVAAGAVTEVVTRQLESFVRAVHGPTAAH
jgi:hypothetical protein